MRQKIFALDGALRATAQEALAMDRSRATAFFAGLALAMAGNTRQAAAVVDELSKRFPGDTVVNNSWGPTIRSEIEANRGNASKAIELLQLASPYERSEERRVGKECRSRGGEWTLEEASAT